MIQADDLRPLNWVKIFLGIDDNGAEYRNIKINGIMQDLVGEWYYLLSNTWHHISQNIEPIPLNEEILLKCGFEKYIKKSNIDGIEMRLQADGNGNDGTYFLSCGGFNGGLYVLVLCKGNYICNNIEYLHELQNLYYSLTKTELQIAL